MLSPWSSLEAGPFRLTFGQFCLALYRWRRKWESKMCSIKQHNEDQYAFCHPSAVTYSDNGVPEVNCLPNKKGGTTPNCLLILLMDNLLPTNANDVKK